MREIFFDTDGGGVFQTVNGRDPNMPAASRLLADILLAEDFTPSEQYETLDCRNWNDDTIKYFGLWVVEQVLEKESVHELTRSVLQRLGWLGVGPSRGLIDNHFGGIMSFKRRIDPRIRGRGPQRESAPGTWRPGEFRRYAKRVADKVQGRPTEDDYRQWASEGRGPTLAALHKYQGGLEQLHEDIGFIFDPDLIEDAHDLLWWGEQVMAANKKERDIDEPDLVWLANHDVGPSIDIITEHFGDTEGFLYELKLHFAASQKRREGAIATYRAHIKEGHLPIELDHVVDTKFLCRVAQYRIARHCIKNPDDERTYIKLSVMGTDGFIRALTGPKGNYAKYQVSDNDIQSAAGVLGVTDLLFPPNTSRLRLPTKK